ncbi:hypothetical protein [Polyangium jinanense]|uniref:Uncharacterized protein n=1 Tax=Polyangium jinanense TaxID=2829994 RepID=A0A9X3XBN0_9BACT|nr:hypothetical protein [Polyangium jinanense]MDC3957760.1 hypothetical protein [Polyangium jinanense]MDC3987552.1 hypothetical protein [Polyangium jinanense]
MTMPSSLSLLLRVSMFGSLVSVAAACGSAETDLDPRSPCTGPGCVNPSGGSTASGGGGGQGGEGGTLSNDVTGNVGVLNEPSFAQIGPYAGAATIFATSSTGMLLEAPYGDMVTSFSLPSVISGTPWIFVRDETLGATGILSTHSAVRVPSSGPVTLPVVDRNVLSSIAATLPAPIVIQTSRAHLIIKVSRNGQPLSGVTLTTPLPGAEIAYDTGVGLYSNQTNLTGAAGVILAFDVDAPATAEQRTFTLTDAAQQGFMIQLPIQASAATVAAFTL